MSDRAVTAGSGLGASEPLTLLRRGQIESLARWAWRRADLVVLGVLLILTAAFGPGFSKINVPGVPIYVTEIAMLATAGVVLARRSLTEIWRDVYTTLPLPWLGLFWLAGVIAALRGLSGYGLDFTLNEIGLFEYSLLLPLIAVVVAARRDRVDFLSRAIVWGGIVALALFVVAFASTTISGVDGRILSLQGAASGLYMGIVVAWVGARLVSGVPVRKREIALGASALVLMGLTEQRSTWIVAFAVLGTLALAAPPRRRLLSVAVGAVALPVALVAAFGIESGAQRIEPVETTVVSGVESGNDGSGTTQISKEISGLTGSAGREGDNVSWRLAYWEELARRTVSQPLLGAGFGRPAAFVWNDRKYDFRDGRPGMGIDVGGPHNSFVNILYRMGFPGLIALLALVGLAAWRSLPLLRADGLQALERARLVFLWGVLAAAVGAAVFNEALKGPYMGMFFWIPLALIYVLLRLHREEGSAPAPADPGARG